MGVNVWERALPVSDLPSISPFQRWIARRRVARAGLECRLLGGKEKSLEGRSRLLMSSRACRLGISILAVLVLCSPFAWAKCATFSAAILGRVDCPPKLDDRVLVQLIFRKHQGEAAAEETALDTRDGSFHGDVAFDTFSSSNLLSGDRCNRRPISVLVRLISAEGKEQDRKTLKFPNDFRYDEGSGRYTVRSALILHGWCKP